MVIERKNINLTIEALYKVLASNVAQNRKIIKPIIDIFEDMEGQFKNSDKAEFIIKPLIKDK